MASNIHIKYPNFCFCPVAGTFGTINQDAATTILRIKTSAGSLVVDYILSSNILDELIHIEYVGPADLTTIMDDLTFFTVEKINTSTSIIKRWETRASSNTLNLKQQMVKSTSGSHYYDITSAAVEHYRTSFAVLGTGAGSSSIVLANTTGIREGTKLFLGPSNDAEYVGAGEKATVVDKVGNTVYLSSNIAHDYVMWDQVSYYVNVYLISNLGSGGETLRGTIFKLDANDGSLLHATNNKVYRNISTARWSPPTGSIAAISSNNSLFIQPYSSYLNGISIYLNNMEDDNYNMFEVHDILFKNNEIYKLMNKQTTKDGDDSSAKTTEDWTPWYNYQLDTLLPYSCSLKIWSDKNYMIGQADTTTLYVKVIDQYGVGLSDKIVNLYLVSGDIHEFPFDPVNGQITTDINGEGSVDYTSGYFYTGVTKITCKADGSSSSTGSEYIWNEIYIYSEVGYTIATPLVDPYTETDLFQVSTLVYPMRVWTVEDDVSIGSSTWGRTFFTTPGGDWVNPSQYAGQVPYYLPELLVGAGDGPPEPEAVDYTSGGFKADGPPWRRPYSNYHLKSNQLTQVLAFESDKGIPQLKEFKAAGDQWTGSEWVDAYIPPYAILNQIIEAGSLQLSQLKMSKHTHWVHDIAYDYLWTDTNLDQFIFVVAAVPKFWSEKNPVDTDVWIKLRPFAASLNALTVQYLVREVWYGGDTGYVDVSSQITYEYFDAAGGPAPMQGVKLTYDPPQDFHYNSVVYIKIGIYDTVSLLNPIPNWIQTSYWFTLVPDYKSPYLENLSPSREQSEVPVDTDVYFEVKDEGAGVDISSLEFTINSRYVTPTSIIKVSDNHYKVTYNPTDNFFFNRRVTVGVKIDDISGYANWLNDSYSFHTSESEDLIFTNLEPGMCKQGLPRFQDVSFVVLGTGEGVDEETLRLQVHDKDVTDGSTIVPIIYRIS
jgi:hypothetical protein